jgi:hypothetical protein
MNWKLVAVILISLILLAVCYLTIVYPLSTPSIVKNYFKKEEQKEPKHDLKTVRKLKIPFSKEEDFKNWCTNYNVFVNGTKEFTSITDKQNDRHTVYYFQDGCPGYKLGYFLVDTDDEGHENYHVPEDGYVIIVNKEHKWTKDTKELPNFSYWKIEI